MNEQEVLKELGSLNLESDTALKITEKYLEFKYIENASCLAFMVLFLIVAAYAVKRVTSY